MVEMKIEKIDVNAIEPNPWNPNEMTKTQYKNLVKEIKKRGFLQPILVRPLDNGRYQIIDGEHRWRAAKEAGLDKVDAVIINIDETRAKILTLNMNHLRGADDVVKLAQVIKDLTKEYDLKALEDEIYITESELQVLLDIEDPSLTIDMLPEKEEKEKKKRTVICPNCGYEFEVD